MSPSNYSFYAIPAYFVLTLLPHSYAMIVIVPANKGKWDNANPRSSSWAATLQKNVPAPVHARYERAKAAHFNMLENMPLFAASLLMGNMARLPSATLNSFALVMLLARLIYTLLYINVSTIRLSRARSLSYVIFALANMWLMIKSANAVVAAS